MNKNQTKQKFTRNLKVVFTFLILSFVISDSYAIKLTLDNESVGLNDIPVLPNTIDSVVEYLYDFSYDHDSDLNTANITTNILNLDSNDPFLCIGPSVGVTPSIFFLDNFTPSSLDDKVHGFVGVDTVSYNYNTLVNNVAVDRVLNIKTNASSQCVVKGFQLQDNSISGNPNVFSDSFEQVSSIVNGIYPDLKIELLNMSDTTLIGQNPNSLTEEIISSDTPFVYKYKFTNNGDTRLKFDFADYFSHSGTLTSWACSPSSTSSCGTFTPKVPGDNYTGVVILENAIIENNNESITVIVTRTSNISTDTSIDLLASVLVTGSGSLLDAAIPDPFPSNNSDTRIFTGVVDSTPPNAPSCSTSPSPANNGTPVTTTCTGVETAATITIPSMTCDPESGNVVACTGTVGTQITVSNDVVTITDGAGNTSATNTGLSIDNVAPIAPTITSPAQPINFVSTIVSSNSLMTGACFETGEIRFTTSPSNQLTGTTIFNLMPDFSFSTQLIWNPSSDQTVVTLIANCVDIAGNLSPDFTVSVGVDLAAPLGPATITNPVVVSNDINQILAGSCGSDAANGDVNITTSPTNAFSPNYNTNVTLDANGDFSISGLTWSEGDFNVVIDCTDAYANGPTQSTIVSGVVIDTTAPVISQITAVANPTNNNTPSYTFTSSEAGTITYGGSCSSGTTAAVINGNTINFDALADGTYSNCTIMVTDQANNGSLLLMVSEFVVDTTAPSTVATISTPNPANSNNLNQNLIGSCGLDATNGSVQVTTNPVNGYSPNYNASFPLDVNGQFAILSPAWSEGNYDIIISCLDEVGNGPTETTVSSAVIIDITSPSIGETTPVPSPTNNPASYTFTSDEVGTISYGGSCSSTTTIATASANTISFNPLAVGTYSNCTITVTDLAGNTSPALSVTSFTVQ